MSAHLFVTSSGTGIGKTYVTALLIRQLRAKEQNPHAFKPVVSGFDPVCAEESDPGVLLASLNRPLTKKNMDDISPWRFAGAMAPNMAAKREGRELIFDHVIGSCQTAMEKTPLLIEGVGGIMAPIAQNKLNIDWIMALNMPAILVVGSYLGTISHTLTAVDAFKTRHLDLAGIVISESEESPVPLEETVEAIRDHVPGIPLMAVTRQPPKAWKSHPDLTHLISR